MVYCRKTYKSKYNILKTFKMKKREREREKIVAKMKFVKTIATKMATKKKYKGTVTKHQIFVFF